MLRIGDFARVCQLPVKTLRYYDELGLFKPALVDEFSGYRYYSVTQLPQMHRLLALREIGLPLEQIARMLDDDPPTEDILGMLRLRHMELLEQQREIRTRLPLLEARLHHLTLEGSMPEYEIVLKTVEPILVASRRVKIPTNDQVPNYLTPAFDEAFCYALGSPAKVNGPGIAVWHTPIRADRDEEVEAAAPIDRLIDETNRIKVHELPEVYVASVVHEGDFALFMQAYEALLKWIEDNGYEIDGPYREVYHKFDPRNRKDTLTEVQVPVVKM